MTTEYKLNHYYDHDSSRDEEYLNRGYTLKIESDKITLNFLGITYSNILHKKSIQYSNENIKKNINNENIVDIFKDEIPHNIELGWKDKHFILYTNPFEIGKSKGFLCIRLYNDDIQKLTKDNIQLSKSIDELVIENKILKEQIEEFKKINISNSIN